MLALQNLGHADRRGLGLGDCPHPFPTEDDPVRVSFELFPPRNDAAEVPLWTAIDRLAGLSPAFFSVTYGAGGSTRDCTHRMVDSIQARTSIPAAAHLTCVDATCTETDGVARAYWQGGIRHIVALRGDPRPDGTAREGYGNADSLVAGLRRLHPFEISVAAYPETHPGAASADSDLDALKRKADAGACRAITQFCFDLDAFERFLERTERAGIRIPIVPGILPIADIGRTTSFAARCGAAMPESVRRRFEGLDHSAAQEAAAIDLAIEQCLRLRRLGLSQFHFYTLNRAALVLPVCEALGLTAAAEPPVKQ